MYVFDDKLSFIHVLLGFMAGVASRISAILSIMLVVGYIVYQIAEQERGESKLGDFIEFILGYIISDIALSTC